MKIYLQTIILSVGLCVLLSMLPLRVIAFTDEGPVLWASGGNVMQRLDSEATGVLGAPSVAIAGVNAKFIIVRANPIKKEFVLGIQDAGGTLRAYHSANGTTWTADWTVVIGDGNVQRFDVTYEQVTGRAMIAYRGRISGGRTTFYYRIWNGTSWTAQTEKTAGPTTSNIVALRLASRPNSNQIGLAYFDDTTAGGAAFWSGTAWSFYANPLTTTGTMYTGFAGIYPPMRGMDISFESIAGDLLVVMGDNTANHAVWVTRSAAGVWSTVNALTTLTSYGDYTELTPSPTTNEIVLSTCMMEPSVSQYLCEFTLWNGAAFGTTVTNPTTIATVDGNMPADAFWLVDGTNRAAVVVYGDATTNGLDWYMSLNGANFITQTTDTTAPAIAATEGQILAIPITGFPRQSLILISDVNNAGYMKRATLSGTTVSWASVTPGSVAEVTAGTYPLTSSTFARMGMALQIAPPLFVFATTSASTIMSIPSGSTTYVADPACTSTADCTGFSLTARGKSAISLSRIMLTNSGTVNLAQTSNWTLDIDADANPNNGITRSVTGTVSGNTITFTVSPALSLTQGKTVYAFPKATFGNAGAYPSGGQTLALTLSSITNVDTTATPLNDELIVGTPTVRGIISPAITSYTNTTEIGLNYTASCTNCGGRIGTGVFAQSITINGFGFGPDPGVGNRASVINQIVLNGAAPTTIASANVTSWSNTQLVIALNTATAGNADSDFGINFGGANALMVTAGGVLGNTLNFNLFPQITGLTVPTGLGPDGAKEYLAGDSDGVITLLGTRFGASQGSSTVQILGCSVTTCVSPADSVFVESWSNTAVRVEVPVIIPDNVYTGTITLARYFPPSAGATVNYANIFSIRPRALSIAPLSGVAGDAFTISGNHLCPTGGVCPTGTLGIDSNVLLAPGFSSADNIVFGTVTANYWNSWSHTQIVSAVPTLTIFGPTNVVVTAGTFPAGQMMFTVGSGGFPPTGNAESTVLDTQTPSGVLYNSITWRGTLGGVNSDKGKVRFQIAAAPCANGAVNAPACTAGTWNYIGGTTCSGGDWFQTLGPDIPFDLYRSGCSSALDGKQYYRYRVQICADDCIISGASTPSVDEIFVSWSP